MALPLEYIYDPANAVTTIDAAADNTAPTVTIAAVTGARHAIHSITFSYDDAVADGKLTVVSGGATTLLDIDVISTAAQFGQLSFDPPLFAPKSDVGEAMVITLSNPGATKGGSVNVVHSTF